MFLVLGVLCWSIVLGLTVRRLGLAEQALFLAGIVILVGVQYFVFGPG